MIVLLYARDYHLGMYGPWTPADTQTISKILLGFSQTLGVMMPLPNFSPNLPSLKASAVPPPVPGRLVAATLKAGEAGIARREEQASDGGKRSLISRFGVLFGGGGARK